MEEKDGCEGRRERRKMIRWKRCERREGEKMNDNG